MYKGFRRSVLRLCVLLFCIAVRGDGHAYVVSGPAATVSATVSTAAPEPTLADVFDGTARFQTIGESEEVTLDMDVDGRGRQRIWDQKLPILHDARSGEYYTFTRGYVEETRKFRIAVLTSRDGRHFVQKGILFPELHADPRDGWTLYDAHLSFDGERYLLTAECASRAFGASLCLSETRTPFDLSSWSLPRPIVVNSPAEGQSASTGVSLHFEGDTYITWTVVDDGVTPYARMEGGRKVLNREDGDESTFSKALKLRRNLDGVFIRAGQSARIGKTIIGARSDPRCTGSWDCNNADIQDWKVEDGKVYAIYNGSNYYRCFRPDGDGDRPNTWNIGIRRADHPLGDYSESSGILIRSAVNDICGISYPVLNTVGGKTYLYYSYYEYGPKGERINRSMRSRLVSGPPLPVTMHTARPRAGGRFGKAVAGGVPDILSDRIQHLYVTFLDRYPINAEIAGHADRARREGYASVVRAVVLSGEHRRMWASRDTRRKIASLYRGILHRPPDAPGFARFEALIAQEGKPLDFLYRLFADSPEFAAANP